MIGIIVLILFILIYIIGLNRLAKQPEKISLVQKDEAFEDWKSHQW